MKRFSKSIFLTILVIAMTIALVGCKSTAKVEEPVLAPSAPAEQPAAEQPAAEQPAAEAPAAEAPAEWIVPLLGYEAKIVYEDKVATITYPSFITDEEVYDAAGVKALSKIPSKEVLLAQLVGSLQGPMQKLAATLQALVDKKNEEAA